MKSKVYVNNINKNIKNNIESYHYKKDDIDFIDDSIDVRSIINEILSSSDFICKSKVFIYLRNKEKIEDEIIALKKDEVLLLSGNKIKLNDIVNIKKAN